MSIFMKRLSVKEISEEKCSEGWNSGNRLSGKKFLKAGLAAVTALAVLTGCSGTTAGGERGNTKVVLNEVAHSIFYAPMYVAIENGYFAEEGIDIELVTGFGADKTMTAVLTGEADIGFMGSESTIYTYAGGTEDYVVNFAQLTQRAGNFLVSREPIDQFDWSMIVGKDVLGGRAGGMPSHDGTWEHIRGIYEWTSRKAPDLKVFKYDRNSGNGNPAGRRKWKLSFYLRFFFGYNRSNLLCFRKS